MGNFLSAWVDPPPEAGEKEYKREFARFFGANWEDVLVGAERPFQEHMYWDGYFAVRGLKKTTGLTLEELAGGAGGCGVRCHHVLAGT